MADRAQSIHKTMVADGFVRKRDGSRQLLFEGTLDIRGRPVAVGVAFPDDTLTRLPKLRLLDRARDLPGIVAHIESEDGVCFAHAEEMQLDPLTPSRTVALCLLKMKEALNTMAKEDLSAEIDRELPQHWLGGSVMVDLPKSFEGTARLYAVPRGKSSSLLLTKDVAGLRRFGLAPAMNEKAISTARDVAVVRMKSRATIPATGRQPENLQELSRWAQANEIGLYHRIINALGELPVSKLTFFLNAPNGVIGGTVTLPVLIAEAVQRKSFLMEHLEKASSSALLERLSCSRVDANFLYSRNLGDQPNLSGLTIALIGAGTIGGTLAKLLAQSGAGYAGGQLTIFDPQAFTAGNVGRHFLGVPHIGMKKAEACREELAALYPDNTVVAVCKDVFEARQELTSFDLVINATGEQGLADVLTEHLEAWRKSGKQVPPILHGWLEGNGVACRALLVTDGSGACFRCLRLQEDGSSQRFGVLRDDHPAHLTPADCGEGVYFAYGAGASAIAAGLMLQMLLDLKAGHPDPKLRTIRIVHAATNQTKDQSPGRLAQCPACGG